MLQILIDGQEATLPQNMAVTLERYNPVLFFDVVKGAKVLDFQLPMSLKNDAIFGHYGSSQVGYKFKDYLCEKRVDGRLLERGFIQLKSVGSDGFEVFYTQNLGSLFGDLQDVKLSAIDFGNVVIPAPLVDAADPEVDAFCFPKIDNGAFYGSNTAGYSGFVNDYGTGVYTAGPQTPMVFLKWLFEQITIKTGVEFSGEFFEDVDLMTLHLYNTFSLDGATHIFYNNHLPDLTIGEFIKELRKVFNLAIYIDVWNKAVKLDFADTVFDREVTVDWSNKFPVLKNKQPELANRLKLSSVVDSIEKAASEMGEYVSAQDHANETLFEITSVFSTLKMESGIPKTEQIGISENYNQQNNKFAAKLLFWRGVQADVPLASNVSAGGIVLNWSAANGLQEKYYTNYEQFRKKTYKVVSAANLNAYDLSRIDMHRRSGELLSVHVQGQNYIIGNQRVNLPLVDLPQIELWRV
jgi:hypothetical protein